MGRLTTHVLDTANGRPAAGVRIRLYACTGGTRRLVKNAKKIALLLLAVRRVGELESSPVVGLEKLLFAD